MALTLIASTGMRQAQQLLIPVSTGELVDKITILEIKKRKIKQPEALKNVSTELELLQEILKSLSQNFSKDKNAEKDGIKLDLEKINLQLWEVEDALRSYESRQYFGPEFIKLARSVYTVNDQRAKLKRSINILCNSSLIEEKSYT